MSCVRAGPTAALAMRPAMRSTVMAVGSTSVGEHGIGQGDEQLGHSPPTTVLPVLQTLSTVIPILSV